MINIEELASKIQQQGYSEQNAEAKLCQDILLSLISKSSLSRNITVKGGVVMRSISGNIRRATQDLDIDFIKYSLTDDGIIRFVDKLNGTEGIRIEIVGKIEQLKHQDYHGKRVQLEISDTYGNSFICKVDIGVHKNLQIEQDEFCFDLGCQEDGVSLLINSREQMVTEKIRSILKFGRLSTRFKDVYDICYLIKEINEDRLRQCFDVYIFEDLGMKENTMQDIYRRISSTIFK
ncbi:hypothetical protein P261_00044 [Lachnospiraceae bacterium TWA4]|nr:hypothetical protein P261_00044 [Lachnospiraceae bacterium TWA4]